MKIIALILTILPLLVLAYIYLPAIKLYVSGDTIGAKLVAGLIYDGLWWKMDYIQYMGKTYKDRE